MGSGGGYHGGSQRINFAEMTPEQQDAYLKEQKEARLRAIKYQKQQRRRKIIKAVIITIVIVAIIVLIAVGVKSCTK